MNGATKKEGIPTAHIKLYTIRLNGSDTDADANTYGQLHVQRDGD